MLVEDRVQPEEELCGLGERAGVGRAAALEAGCSCMASLAYVAAVTPGIHWLLDALHETGEFPFTFFPLLLLDPHSLDPVELST